jgi:O-antigen/teichoic acid export membrane protein
VTRPDGASTQARSRAVLGRWRIIDGPSRSLLSNAGSLFGATVVTSGIGAIFWALAARIFPAPAVGVAAAAISAMLLMGQVATIGLGTVLMGELSQHEGSERGLIYSAATISAVVGAVLGAVFIAAASWIAPELNALNVPTGVLLFAIGVASTASGFVLDQAFIGLLRGGLQLLRNTIASMTKLIVLIVIGGIGFVVLRPDGTSLLLTWVAGAVVSMALILAVPRSSDRGPARPLWHVPEGLAGLALRHHLLNLSILAPGLLLPLLVTAVMSAEADAYFYIAYMIASLGWAVPAALATALYASGARDIEALTVRMRLAFWLCIGAGIALNLFMLVGAGPLLSIFGAPYADRAGTLLRLLSLGIFPVTINSLYVPIARLERRFLQGTILMVAGMLVEFSFVVVGARAGGLDGTGVGWLVGFSIGALPLLPTVFRVAVRRTVKPISGDLFGQLPGLGSRPDALDADV